MPSLWIIGGQEFDDAEPVLLILPVRLQIVFALRSSKDLIVSAFRKHSGQMKRVFSELSPEDLRGLEVKLKKVGKRAATLMEES